MVSHAWLLLTYKVPPEPASKRVALWRRLKGMGSVYLQNGVCLLPKTDDHVRRLKMIENDVAEAKGESVILETVALDKGQEEKVVARFKADRDEAYEEFIDKCDDFEREVAKEVAVRQALERAGWTIGDIDRIEINEAFAAIALAVTRELGLAEDIVNVEGGAIAHGHPIGATGAVLTTRLLHSMKRDHLKCGVVTLCIGGGQGIALALETIV